MKTGELRRRRILDRLERSPFASVRELAGAMRCSQMTIRRDLALLEALGRIDRTHGGAALSYANGVKPEPPPDAETAEFDRLARAAALLIEPGSRVILADGPAPLAVARRLAERDIPLWAITNDLAVAQALSSAPQVHRMITGGSLTERGSSLFGPLLNATVDPLRVDWAVFGCDGLSVTGGLTRWDPRMTESSRRLLERADRRLLVAPSRVARHDAFFRFARFTDLDVLVTDSAMPREALNAAREAGVEVEINAEPDHPARDKADAFPEGPDVEMGRDAG